ncbi:hypothetical protein BDV23DRAFT_157508 [Aspergillus alliaceus]|uniref:Uncharacterized protein n=1 Tax=Petromyces alliaceus TaxID=209559 RepID=A0A5N7C545_PETAA|nr:hypothetical protein BDV23DRAFT_157508 [Aspergillus alliaceus]
MFVQIPSQQPVAYPMGEVGDTSSQNAFFFSLEVQSMMTIFSTPFCGLSGLTFSCSLCLRRTHDINFPFNNHHLHFPPYYSSVIPEKTAALPPLKRMQP